MSIKILDCTLRDGGYINDWRFGKRTILSILDKLESANIDIIECGFLTNMAKDEDCSLFRDNADIRRVLPKRQRSSMFVAMIAIGEKELDPSLLSPYDGSGIEGVRLTFHKEEIPQALQWAEIIMEKGYKVFMQPVGTVYYSDMELLQLVEKMNRLNPYAFYIVDTLGSMYRNEVSHRFYLIDENTHPEIRLGFHGHNNLQLAFSNAQVLGKIQTKRTLILDSSVYGMGRGAGNLPTELITQYINKNIESRYDVTIVMDIYDEYISHIRKEHEWGYTMPYHIAASNICHPNYAAYLINKRTLTTKDIEKIIQSIPAENKVVFNKKLIERLYMEYQNNKIDDSEAVSEIAEIIKGKKLLLLAPGKSISDRYRQIMDYIEREKPYVITVNFVDDKFRPDACFISSHKRMNIIGQDMGPLKQIRAILTSNLKGGDMQNFLYVDYECYTNSDDMVSDNAGLMLLRLLVKCGAAEISLAGFDGGSYRYDGEFIGTELKEKQERIRDQIAELSKSMKISFLTPSVYEQGEKNV